MAGNEKIYRPAWKSFYRSISLIVLLAAVVIALTILAPFQAKVKGVLWAAWAVVAIAIFLWRDLGRAMDRFTQVLGLVMLAMIAYVVVRTSPPAAESVREIVKPSVIDWTTILTLVGGTVGGYITFSGAHRIIDAGIVGTENLGRINRGSLNGILITGIMRFLLFMAVLGVVVTGVKLDPSNPAADAFRIAAGEVGYRIFGVILWSAAITSVVGCSYTSVSFLRTLFGFVERYYRYWIIGFILASTMVLTQVGRPVTLLVLAGSLNGMILPLSLASMLLAVHRRDIMGEYRHPVWLTVLGWVMVAFTAWMAWGALQGLVKLFGR